MGDERHAVPAFEQIGLEAAVAGARVVRDAGVRRDIGGGGEAVIGGKNHERVFGEAVSFEGRENAANVGVHMDDKVTVRGGGFAHELVVRQNGGVR